MWVLPKFPCRKSYKVRFKVSVVEWQYKNETNISRSIASVFTSCVKSLLKAQTCGTLGKRRRLCCGKPLYILNRVGRNRPEGRALLREKMSHPAYSFSTQYIQNLNPACQKPQLRSDLRANVFLQGDAFHIYLLCAPSYTQSAITISSQRRCVATIEILFAKNCRIYVLGHKNGLRSDLRTSNLTPETLKFSYGEHAPRPP